MDNLKCSSANNTPSVKLVPGNMSSQVYTNYQAREEEESFDGGGPDDTDINLREVYFLVMHFLSAGPCQRTFPQLWDELMEHDLLPRRYHAWFSRNGACSGEETDDGISFPLHYSNLIDRYSHIQKDHLIKLLKQLVLAVAPPFRSVGAGTAPGAADVPTLLGTGSFSLLSCHRDNKKKQVKHLMSYLRWPHMQADQLHALSLREIGGGFSKHHRAPSTRFACYAIAKPSTMVQKMQLNKKLRGHRDAVYCAIFDRSGRYIITGSDDRLVKIWSMETAFCLASCRGHVGDITDLAVSSNNAVVASASNDFSIRVWRLPDGHPISVLNGHTGAVTAIAFNPKPNSVYQLLSSSDDGTCRIWDARSSQCSPRVYLPKPPDVVAVAGKSIGPSSSNVPQSNRILCCAYNANGTFFVTGSSDTYARVWSAVKCNVDDPEKPSHEIDILAGHENDVNYVQFSGCAVTPRSSTSDSIMEDNVPKFRNSWHRHDNIVTCSRDGSAIIWILRSRRSTVKGGRWTRAYHLKVPPPPMPPQPPRGGPRQRFLPTPRGVNMIVWSLDNRFVLAAIMDCRICVWNASDGSLVHSLTGHSASTYVLDVHPFNPRIAMSAGYDGKTIIWDIWEGTPIRIYETGPYKLVDGKFSPDGTSIVLSDDVGQIYLLNTGQGESQKDAKYDQFFLGDYRPLIQDTHGNVVDQETQLVPYRRNILDFLCDSSMFPYPEPYQSIFQRRRLGALGLEWRPSTIKFAIGTDIPLADLNVVIEPLPDLTDVIFWEPENDLIDDDTDSEYNATADYYNAGHNVSLSESSSSDSVFSGDEMSGLQKRESLRSSKRRKRVSDVEVMTSPKRHVKKRIMNEQVATSSRSRRMRKTGNCRKTSSKKKNVPARSSRPKRIAKANANSGYNLHSEGSTDEEDEATSESDSSFASELKEREENSVPARSSRPKRIANANANSGYNLHSEGSTDEEDEDKSESDPSFASEFEERELAINLDNRSEYQRGERESVDKVEIPVESDKLTDSHHVQNENKKPLILKFSFRNTKTTETLKPHFDKTDVACSSLNSSEPSSRDNRIASDSFQPGYSLTKADEMAPNCTLNDLGTVEEPVANPNGKLLSLHDETISSWGEVKSRSSKRMQSGDASIRDTISSDSHHRKDICSNDPEAATNFDPDVTDGLGSEFFAPEDMDSHSHDYSLKIHDFGVSGNQSITQEGSKHLDPHRREGKEMITNIEQSSEKTKSWRPKIRIKSRSILEGSKGDSMGIKSSLNHPSKYDSCMEQNSKLSLIERNYNSAEPSTIRPSSMNRNVGSVAMSHSYVTRVNPQGRGGELEEHVSKGNILNEERETGFPHAATDASRRVRSLKLKAASRQTVNSCNLKPNQGQMPLDSPEKDERASSRVLDYFPSTRGASTSNSTIRTRSLRPVGEQYPCQGTTSQTGTNFFGTQKKANWLLLPEQEEGNGYVPQLNDEVMYIRQGHHEYLGNNNLSLRGPWTKYWTNTRVVELCLVEDLKYATHGGSGESCCEITLKFIDSSSMVQGQKFRLSLPDICDSPDFLVERSWYDASMERNWSSRDKCQVWWTNAGGRDGSWWDGRIQAVNVQSSEFPGSPWKIVSVRYKNEEEEYNHCPWELHDRAHLWEPPQIDPGSSKKMLSSIRKLQRSATNKEDYYGILKLEQVAQKSDFINRFPVPLSLDIIQQRLVKNYYRRVEALKYDINVLLSNAQSYFDGNRPLSKKMKNLSHWFDELFLELE